MMMMFTFMVVGLFITFSRLGSLFPLNENAQNTVGFFFFKVGSPSLASWSV